MLVRVSAPNTSESGMGRIFLNTEIDWFKTHSFSGDGVTLGLETVPRGKALNLATGWPSSFIFHGREEYFSSMRSPQEMPSRVHHGTSSMSIKVCLARDHKLTLSLLRKEGTEQTVRSPACDCSWPSALGFLLEDAEVNTPLP